MLAGDLEPLADLLGQEQDDLHPTVQRILRRLIVGSAEESDYRLKVQRHPDLKNGQSSAHQSRQVGLEMTTALAMVRNGALCAGMFESATEATMKQTKMKRAAVLKHWGRQKRYYIRGLRNGTIDKSILPGPISPRHLNKST
jgi:hypothetical protein